MEGSVETSSVVLDQPPPLPMVVWQSVEPKLKSLLYLKNFLIFLTTIPCVLLLLWLVDLYSSLLRRDEVWIEVNVLVIVSIVVIGTWLSTSWILLCISPPVQVANYGYAKLTNELVFQKGFIRLNKVRVPFEQFQHVSTTRGPLEQLFKLASLNVYTAAGRAIKVPGLQPQCADQLRDELLQMMAMTNTNSQPRAESESESER